MSGCLVTWLVDRHAASVVRSGHNRRMLVIGHRGASAAAPENTVEAFVLAAKMGADGVELDVRLAPDGRLIVKHDPLPHGGPEDDAAGADVLDGFPVLSTILAACGDLLVNVEIKNSIDEDDHDPSRAVVEPTIAEMRLHGAPARWIISSFDWATIERCRVVASDIATAFLVVDATDAIIARTAAAGHLAIHPWEPSVTTQMVERAHAAGLAVNTWTCNDADRLVELEAMGVDGVCTDVPDVALRTLGRTAGSATSANEGPTTGRVRWGRPA